MEGQDNNIRAFYLWAQRKSMKGQKKTQAIPVDRNPSAPSAWVPPWWLHSLYGGPKASPDIHKTQSEGHGNTSEDHSEETRKRETQPPQTLPLTILYLFSRSSQLATEVGHKEGPSNSWVKPSLGPQHCGGTRQNKWQKSPVWLVQPKPRCKGPLLFYLLFSEGETTSIFSAEGESMGMTLWSGDLRFSNTARVVQRNLSIMEN